MPTFIRNGQSMPYEDFTTGEGESLANEPALNLVLWSDEQLLAHGIERHPDPEPEPPGLPAEIPMHKAKKALAILGPAGAEDETKWLDLVEAAIDGIENPISRRCTQIEFSVAPNLVLNGATTLAVMAAIGMSEEQRDTMAAFALTLP